MPARSRGKEECTQHVPGISSAALTAVVARWATCSNAATKPLAGPNLLRFTRCSRAGQRDSSSRIFTDGVFASHRRRVGSPHASSRRRSALVLCHEAFSGVLLARRIKVLWFAMTPHYPLLTRLVVFIWWVLLQLVALGTAYRQPPSRVASR